jgi:hypothetical protein
MARAYPTGALLSRGVSAAPYVFLTAQKTMDRIAEMRPHLCELLALIILTSLASSSAAPQNGVLIQIHVQLQGETVYIGKPQYKKHNSSPIKLQSHEIRASRSVSGTSGSASCNPGRLCTG